MSSWYPLKIRLLGKCTKSLGFPEDPAHAFVTVTDLHVRQEGQRVWLGQISGELEKGASPDGLIVCAPQMGDVGEIDRTKRRIHHTFSAKTPDRSRDIIEQTGIKFDSYDSNPVWLLAHDTRGLPIARSVEHGVKGGKAYSVPEFYGPDDTEHGRLCETVFRLTAEKFMRACSLGGRMLKYNLNEQRRGIDILELDLYEISKVSVPDQPLALAKNAASAGIDLGPLLDWGFRLIEDATKEGQLDESRPLILMPEQANALAKHLGYGRGLELVQFSALLTTKAADEPAPESDADPVAEKAVDADPAAAPAPLTAEDIRRIIREEMAAKDAAPAPAVEPAPVVKAQPPDPATVLSPAEMEAILQRLVKSKLQQHVYTTTGRLPEE